MSRPHVSVVIPAYNSGEYLAGAIESIFRQTFADWELIVVDDASTDGTEQRLACYCDPRLMCLRNPVNLGQARSLNRALSVARGRYVACLDHDDLAEPERLARQVEFLDAHPEICLVGSWVTVIGADGLKLADSRPPTSSTVLVWALTGSCPFAHSSVLFRREPVLALGGYDPDTAPAMDYDLWTRLVQSGAGASVLPHFLTRVRSHPGQVSRVRAQQMARAAVGVASRHVQWLLGEVASAEAVEALLSLFDVQGGGCRNPQFGQAVTLLRQITLRCAQRFGHAAVLRRAAASLFMQSARSALLESSRFSGSRKLLFRGGRALFAAVGMACR